MPLVKKQPRVKRVKVLTKRIQLFGGRSKAKSYNTIYGKLKTNNNSLAKALSNQKQENQLLFSQNVELRAQLHALDTACNKRDLIISKIHKNAKDILGMLVNMTNSVTKTIICCQEFTPLTDNNARSSIGTVARKDSTRRHSEKAPARGIVKPMVSGHTITKPTINLSRLNMGQLTTIANLSNIEEIASPSQASPVLTDIRTPVTTSANENRTNYDGRSRRRLPERIPILFSDDEEVQRLSRRNGRSSRHSRRSSNILSKSITSRHSNNALLERIGSPRVALNDVSKLLRNSQTFNVQQLSEESRESISNNNSTVEESTHVQPITRPMSQLQTGTPNDQSTEVNTNIEHFDREPKKQIKRNTVTWEDPLEGPSWKYNASSVMNDLSIYERDVIPTGSSNANTINDQSNQKIKSPKNPNDCINLDESMEFTECITNITGRPPVAGGPFLKFHDPSCMLHQSNNVEVRAAPPTTVVTTNSEMNNVDLEEEPVYNFPGPFVTIRQHSTFDDEDDDDYTLMYMPRQRQANMNYDVNDLKLPVLEGPIIPPSTTDESEPEVTVTVQKITQNFPVPALSNDSVDRPMFEQTINVNLPQVPDVDDQTERISYIRKRSSASNVQKGKRMLLSVSESPLLRNEKLKKKRKPVSCAKDPSAVKVVSQKLNETFVREKSPLPLQSQSQSISPSQSRPSPSPSPSLSPSPPLLSPERISSRTTGRSRRNVSTYSQAEVSMDSENSSNASINSETRPGRPRRQKAPVNLKEPNLKSFSIFQKTSKKFLKNLDDILEYYREHL
ncbi:uncharacterized protein LOC107265733 isoform X1 [Cephus cinctus]|uniref:Uncharacterized protein LOC107265733 isoform X1 n=1 Tax=Cephus cinctus TaxID=211228 RepID=A0AAJ7RDY3_CEPCN|nr:uncharacterized protein LOC107265733 isoform X1 [Cephus cinctus]